MKQNKSNFFFYSRAIKKLKKVIISNSLKILPNKILHQLITKNLDLTKTQCDGLTFSIATTKHELEQAYHLLYQCYLHEGLMQENSSKLRITPYHALPTTSTLIGKIDNKVIVTVSVIKSSNFGIPLDKIININSIPIKAEESLGEVSALAIHPDFRGHASRILFPMIKYMYHYSQKYLHLDYYIIGVHPRWFSFYEIIFDYKKIKSGQFKEYSFVNNAPLQVGYINAQESYYYLSKTSQHIKSEKNLFKYFMEIEEDIFHYPDRVLNKSFDYVINQDLFNYFFQIKTNAIDDFSNKQLRIIQNILFNSKLHIRNGYRAWVKFESRFYYTKNEYIDTILRDVSKKGVCIFLKKPPQLKTQYKIKVMPEKFITIELICEFVSIRRKNTYGLKIIKTNETWNKMIIELNRGIDHQRKKIIKKGA